LERRTIRGHWIDRPVAPRGLVCSCSSRNGSDCPCQ
jgi:hypothetical protein